jgi:hypothetical protein
MKISDLFPSRYMKASDLNGREVRLKINYIQIEDIGQEPKPVMHFVDKQKGLTLNKTNARILIAAYGDDADLWQDRDVILCPTMVDFRGTPTQAIRIKIPPAAGGAAMLNRVPGNQPPSAPATADGPEYLDDIPF